MTAHPRQRKTLAASASISGKGLFTSQSCTLSFHPSDQGLTIMRTDVAAPVRVHCSAIDATPVHSLFTRLKGRSTNLAHGHGLAATVEHVLSALAGLGITDCRLEIDAPELPILDGSAKPFVDALLDAKPTPLDGAIDPITLEESITIKARLGPGHITLDPREEPGWSVAYELDYGAGAYVPPQTVRWDGSPEAYIDRIAPARTYSLEHEATSMKAAGLFKDLTPTDMLVIGKDGPIDNAYRMDDEPACHKLLDAIGDLSLAGKPIQADITCHRSGHELNHRAAHALEKISRGVPHFMP